jgi:hypothetical protein
MTSSTTGSTESQNTTEGKMSNQATEYKLRYGETLVVSLGQSCSVCHKLIKKGLIGVKLSSYTKRLRHVECMPKTDKRACRPVLKGRWMVTQSTETLVDQEVTPITVFTQVQEKVEESAK